MQLDQTPVVIAGAGPVGVTLSMDLARLGVPSILADVAAEDAGGAWDRVPLVLVRPDQHVAWRSRTAPTSQEAGDVIATVTGKSY